MQHTRPDLEHLKLVARLALLFATTAFAGVPLLVALAALIAPEFAGDRYELPLWMALSGIPLAAVLACGTWLVILRGSFRVAGPLQRFCAEFEQALRGGRPPCFRIRATDAMHDEARHLEEAAGRVQRHLDEIAGALESASLRVRRGHSRATDSACPGERVHRLIDEVRL